MWFPVVAYLNGSAYHRVTSVQLVLLLRTSKTDPEDSMWFMGSETYVNPGGFPHLSLPYHPQPLVEWRTTWIQRAVITRVRLHHPVHAVIVNRPLRVVIYE